MAELELAVAGVGLRLELEASEHVALWPQWAGFAQRAAEPLVLRARPASGAVSEASLRQSPRAVKHGDAMVIDQGELFTCRYEPAARRAELAYRDAAPDRAGFGSSGIRGAVACLVAVELAARDGFLLHACGVRFGDDAMAALGRSGAGKSTLSGMFPAEDVLNDELVAVRVRDGQAVAHATPFSGSLSDPRRDQSAPLRALLELHKGEPARLEAWPAADALPLAMRCVTLPEGLEELERACFARMSGLVNDLARRRLVFPRHGEGVPALVRDFVSNV